MLPYVELVLILLTAALGYSQSGRIARPLMRSLTKIASVICGALAGLFLACSIPGGPIDIADFLDFARFAIWPFLLGGSAVLAAKINYLWLRRTIVALFSIATLPAALMLLTLSFSELGCTHREPPLYSPDGKHLALVRFAFQGALGADYGVVYVRRNWKPIATRVYSGVGSWSLDPRRVIDPQVRWINNSNLAIRYSASQNEPPMVQLTCAEGINIVYEVMYPNSLP